MLTLLIDTCTERSVVALERDKQILYKFDFPFGYHSSSHLLSAIQKALIELELGIEKINYIALSTGPGSYTGIRMGAVVAYVFSYTHNIPIITFSSLEGFIPSTDGPFASLIDAKIGGVYLLVGNKIGNHIEYDVTGPKLSSLHEAYSILKEVPVLVTPNKSRLLPLFQKEFSDCNWAWEETAPNASHLFLLANEKASKNIVRNHSNIDIMYLRKTQAEIESGY